MSSVPTLKPVAGGFRIRLRCGRGKQLRFVIKLANEEAARARAMRLAELGRSLVAAGKIVEAPVVLTSGAEAQTEAAFREVESVARDLCREVPPAPKRRSASMTFRQLGQLWTSGELHKRYPDHVKVKRSVEDDIYRLARLYKSVGDVPLPDFTVDDAERAMSEMPEGRSPATRRHYAQLISKLLRLAEYPCRLIARSPLPRGFLPQPGSRPALSYLYPAEDARLLACTEVPLGMRLLYGMLAREGLRLGEALELRWRHLDLTHGTVRLERTKTGDARTWALSEGVVAAFRALRSQHEDDDLVFSDVRTKAANAFRAHLRVAGVTRPELFERTAHRRPIRIHDLRATMITLALANGRTETWVQDRTGHTTSAMLNRYRRQARHASELHLGELAPLNEAIPDLPSTEAVEQNAHDGDADSSRAASLVVPSSVSQGVSHRVSHTPRTTRARTPRYPSASKEVRERGVEPPRLAAPEPKSGASASSATRAL
jgi:integrase